MVSFWVKQQQADLGQFVAAGKKNVVHWLNHPKIAKICKHHINIFIYYIYLQFTIYAYENANIYMLGKTYPCGAMSSAGFGVGFFARSISVSTGGGSNAVSLCEFVSMLDASQARERTLFYLVQPCITGMQ